MFEKLKRIPLYAAIFAGFYFACYGLIENPNHNYRQKENITKILTEQEKISATRPVTKNDLKGIIEEIK